MCSTDWVTTCCASPASANSRPSWPLFGQKPPENYTAALSRIAKEGWAFQQHSLSPAENELTVSTFEAVNKTTPIKDLRWSLAHVGTR